MTHVSSRPPNIPYGGFSPVRLQAQAPRSSVCRLPPRAPHCSLIPAIPADYRPFTPAFETTVHQPGCPPLGADLWRCPSPLSPEGLAPTGVGCPCLPRLATSSARLKTSTALPSMASERGGLWHARLLLPGLHTFRTCTAVLSRIAVRSFRRESGTRVPPLFRTSAGHRVEGSNPWHLQHSRHQRPAGSHCRRLVRSLALRPSWLLASWAEQTELGLSLPKASTSGLPAPQSPCGLPDITPAPHGAWRRPDCHL